MKITNENFYSILLNEVHLFYDLFYEIEDYNVMIEGQNFFDQPMKVT